MLIRHPPGWKLPETATTPEAAFRQRRDLLGNIAAGSAWLATTSALASWDIVTARAESEPPDPNANLYPAPRNLRYDPERAVMAERYDITFGNFYEFGPEKNISVPSQALKTHPWTVTIGGLVERAVAYDADELIRRMPLEERIYRHRCVEGWAMTLPWTGFPLAKLIDLARPLSSARYVRFTSFGSEALPLSISLPKGYAWPYVEALTIAEATNELAFIATGLYGKPITKQNGAPLRVVVPWKYAFKDIKSIIRIDFVDRQPRTFWPTINPNAYGFWGNVNPNVSHPRWSQATELLRGTNERVSTQIFNGYENYVGYLYSSLQDENLYR